MATPSENITPSPDEQGYWLPEYWGGHFLGDGHDAQRFALAGDSSSKKMALRSLRSYFASNHPVPPLISGEHFADGQAFDAGEHPSGSLFWMIREMLVAKLPIQRFAFSSPHPPLPPQEVSNSDKCIEWSDGNNYGHYRNERLWGMTGTTKRGSTTFYIAPHNAVSLTPRRGGWAVTPNEQWIAPNTFTVGEVSHNFVGEKYAMLERTLRIYECTLPRSAGSLFTRRLF